MKHILSTLTVLCLVALTSCKKELSIENLLPPPAPKPPLTRIEQFTELLVDSKFQLRGFTSDIPVDYNERDNEIKQETDLWSYVSPYLKDDVDRFSENGRDVIIEQNELKMPGEDSPILRRNYLIAEDSDGVYMTFLDYQYTPLTYRLVEFTDSYFILSVGGPQGSTLYSRFETLP